MASSVGGGADDFAYRLVAQDERKTGRPQLSVHKVKISPAEGAAGHGDERFVRARRRRGMFGDIQRRVPKAGRRPQDGGFHAPSGPHLAGVTNTTCSAANVTKIWISTASSTAVKIGLSTMRDEKRQIPDAI